MASSSTNPYSIYPYPSEFNVSDLVPDKLSKSNYSEWKPLMLDFIESRGMNEFIHHTAKDIEDFKDPKKDIEDPNFDDYNERSWRKSDGLVRTWILSTLNKDIIKQVLHHKTAREVWKALETKLGPLKAQQPDPSSQMEEAERELHSYMPLHIAAIQGDVRRAKNFIDSHPEAICKPISTEGETVLITAVRSVRRNELVKYLLPPSRDSRILQASQSEPRIGFMLPEELCQSDNLGRTALHEAAEVGNLEAAKMLVEHDCDLLIIEDKKKQTPLICAAKTGNREMVRFLLDRARARVGDGVRAEAEAGAWAGAWAKAKAWARARTETVVEAKARARAKAKARARAKARAEAGRLGFSETGRVPPTLLYHLANSGLYDIALELLQQNSMLACNDTGNDTDTDTDTNTDTSTGSETCPLMAMCQKRSSFRSGTPLNSFQKFIYSMTGRWHAIHWHLADQFVPPIKHIREIKLKHDEALELVKCLCKEIAKLDFSTATWMFTPALAQATSSGIHEIVEEILRSYPAAIYFKNENKQSIFQSAIVWRRENVFNLIYQLKECSHKFLSVPDRFGNNALHLAGCLGPQQHLSVRVSAAGAALQMQRELQWFKEVEKFVLPQDKECRNDDGLTPAEVFTKTHKELVEAGERWMKDTATSCTIVAALIATVMFAAAITVPGGNNASISVSIFSKQKAFIIFGLSDALALFASIASLLMFLSILTARYAEEDFLYSLPNRLIIGLVNLFLSISSTMTAFGATLYLMLGENRRWILYPIVAFACIPVTLFVFLLFPLLVVMYKSTYHPAIFGKQSDHMLF